MPEKFKRCVRAVKRKQNGKNVPYNPYAVCRKSTVYKGSTKEHSVKGRRKIRHKRYRKIY